MISQKRLHRTKKHLEDVIIITFEGVLAAFHQPQQKASCLLLVREGLCTALNELAQKCRLVLLMTYQRGGSQKKEAIREFLQTVEFDAVVKTRERSFSTRKIVKLFPRAKNWVYVTWAVPPGDEEAVTVDHLGPLPYTLHGEDLLVLAVPHLALTQTPQGHIKAVKASTVTNCLSQLAREKRIQSQSLYYQSREKCFDHLACIKSPLLLKNKEDLDGDLSFYHQVLQKTFQTFYLQAEAKLIKIADLLKRVSRRERLKQETPSDTNLKTF